MSIWRIVATVLLLFGGVHVWAQTSAQELARVLREKQIITVAEYEQIVNTGTIQQLAIILRDKGLLTQTEAASLNLDTAPSKPAQVATLAPAPSSPTTPAPAPPAKPVEAGGDPDMRLKFYGTVLFNAFFNDQSTNNSDIPLFTNPKAAGPQSNFGATARQTRLGFTFAGPIVAGAKLSGALETDFFGGDPSLANGVNMDLMRIRLAYGRLDWKRFSFEAGQDWAIFAPLNPTSFAEFSIPEFSASGNLWIRTPQLRAEWKQEIGNGKTFLWQVGALNPDIGDNSASAFAIARQPRAGELGRLPAVETRLAFSTPLHDHKATFGMSGHWGTAKNTSMMGNPATRDFESWGVATDFVLPLSKLVNISGEAYAGRALGLFSAGISQTVMPIGQPGENGVGTRGGWLQVQLNPAKKWQGNLAYGIDAPLLQNLITGSRSKNQSYMSNVIYHLSPNVAFALEWRRFLTNYRNQALSNNITDHFNLAVAYTF